MDLIKGDVNMRTQWMKWFIIIGVICSFNGLNNRVLGKEKKKSSRTISPEEAFPPAPDSPEMAWWRKSMETKDARITWWRNARFGCFMHWGVYSQLEGYWKGEKVLGYAEHIQRIKKITMAEYRKEAVEKFNPTQFNADEWIKTIKQAGMRYLIITSKHHDGFAMFDSDVSDYTIVKATPFHRDPMRELRDACKREGIKFGFYYSHAFDWGEPMGSGNDWEWENPGGGRNLYHEKGGKWWQTHPEIVARIRKNYVEKKAMPQIRELLVKYDPDIIWFDTTAKLPPQDSYNILKMIRSIKPNIVVNGRLLSSRKYGNYGDYRNTTDRPAEIRPTEGDWEGIPTTNESYAYHRGDLSHKPPEHFIQLLIKTVARGGNMLMNIGPTGKGLIDAKDLTILQGIGKWMAINSESIYGAGQTPLAVQAWGESTYKTNALYLQVFDWPKDGQLIVGGLLDKPISAEVITATGKKKCLFEPIKKMDLKIMVPAQSPSPASGVIKLTFSKKPQTDLTRLISPSYTNLFRVFDGTRHGNLGFGSGKRNQDYVTKWKSKDYSVSWNARINQSSTFDVFVRYVGSKNTGGKFVVQIGDQTLTGVAKNFPKVGARNPSKTNLLKLGEIKLKAGAVPISVKAQEITGKTLMHLQDVILRPVHP